VSDFVLTPAAQGDLLKILECLEGENYRPATNPLEIVRVLHGGRDLRRLLRD